MSSDDDVIGTGESKAFSLKIGKRQLINVNGPCRFVVKTTGGSIIEGVITPNNPLAITSAGDVDGVEVNIEDESTGMLRRVE